MEGETVDLYVYDLSQGMAAAMSQSLLGKYIEGVWHTSIVVGSTVEYYYGGGVQQGLAGATPFGRPYRVIPLGRTQVPHDLRQELIADLAASEWTAEAYDLFHHNCNHFSNELAMVLVGQGIPEHIVMLPQEVLSTPFGQMIAPMLTARGGLQSSLGNVRQNMPLPPMPMLSQGRPIAHLPGTSTRAPDESTLANHGPAVNAAHDQLEIATAAAALEEAAEEAGFPHPIPMPHQATASEPAAGQVGSAPPTATGCKKRGVQPSDSAPTITAAAQKAEAAAMAAAAPEAQPKVPAAEAKGSANGKGTETSRSVKAELEAAVRAEFVALMSGGGLTPNQAAVMALERVKARPAA